MDYSCSETRTSRRSRRNGSASSKSGAAAIYATGIQTKVQRSGKKSRRRKAAVAKKEDTTGVTFPALPRQSVKPSKPTVATVLPVAVVTPVKASKQVGVRPRSDTGSLQSDMSVSTQVSTAMEVAQETEPVLLVEPRMELGSLGSRARAQLYINALFAHLAAGFQVPSEKKASRRNLPQPRPFGSNVGTFVDCATQEKPLPKRVEQQEEATQEKPLPKRVEQQEEALPQRVEPQRANEVTTKPKVATQQQKPAPELHKVGATQQKSAPVQQSKPAAPKLSRRELLRLRIHGGAAAAEAKAEAAARLKKAKKGKNAYAQACAKPKRVSVNHKVRVPDAQWRQFIGNNFLHTQRMAAMANMKLNSAFDVAPFSGAPDENGTLELLMDVRVKKKHSRSKDAKVDHDTRQKFKQLFLTFASWRLELIKWKGEREKYQSVTRETFQKLVARKNQAREADRIADTYTGGPKRRKLTFVERRLLNELRELEKRAHEFPNIAVCIPEDNLKEWHVNLRAPDGPMKGKVAHVRVVFPRDYPTSPPKISLVSNLSGHPNAFGDWLCLDMIKSYTSAKQYEGWTPCYTMASLLMQLQTFLFAENVPQERSGRTGRQYGENTRKNCLDATTYDAKQRGVKCSCGFNHHKNHIIPAFQAPISNKTRFQCLPTQGHKITVASRHVAHQREQEVPLNIPDMLIWKTVLSFLDGSDLIHSTDAFIELARCAERWNMTARLTQRCYYTQEDSRQTVLGVGFKLTQSDGAYTENIESDGHLLSVDAWSTHKHHQGAYGAGYENEHEYNNFLPLALNPVHFRRAQPYLDATLANIVKSNSLNSHKKLDTLCDLMLKCLVNLMSSFGRDQCEAAVVDFCRLHHLLLSYCREDPRLRHLAIKRLNRYQISGGSNKSLAPNNGHVMMYQTVADEKEIGGSRLKLLESLLRESTVRGFKWADKDVLDEDALNSTLVEKYFISRTTSRRIMLFQNAFVKHMCASSWEQTLASYDVTSGEATQEQIQALYADLLRITRQDEGWSDYYRHLGLAHLCPKDMPAMAALIRARRKQSEMVMYHSTDIQAGRVNRSLVTEVQKTTAGSMHARAKTSRSATVTRKVDDSGFRSVYNHQGVVEDDWHVPKLGKNWDGVYVRAGWYKGVPIWEKKTDRRMKAYSHGAYNGMTVFSFMVDGGRMLTKAQQRKPVHGKAHKTKTSFF